MNSNNPHFDANVRKALTALHPNGDLICGLMALLLTGCSTPSHDSHLPPTKPSPETVLVTYHVRPGKERELEQALARAWEIYRKNGLVFTQPHVIVRGEDENNTTRCIEIFTWVSNNAPDHAPASVKALWNEMQSLCEARDVKKGIEGGEVELVLPKLAR